MVSIGVCSSHSPGWLGATILISSSRARSMPIFSAVIAVSGPGADQTAMMIETINTTMVITTDCQRKIVSENGITPVMGRRLFGRLAALACSCAAEEDSPMAQVAPSPREAAAAAARNSRCRSIIHPQFAAFRESAYQQTPEDKAQAPVEQGSQNADGGDKPDRTDTILGHAR